MEAFLEFVSDAHESQTPKELLISSLEHIVTAYYDMMSGKGAEAKRTKGVLMLGMRNQMAAQIIQAKAGLIPQ